VKPEAKRDVRWEDKSANPEDTGTYTSSSAKIRVMNHKEYKTWKVKNAVSALSVE